MSSRNKVHHELLTLLEAVCEDRLSSIQSDRLQTLLSDDAEARKFYREYMLLHGTLYWDTAIETDSLIGQQLSDRQTAEISRRSDAKTETPARARRVVWTTGVVAAMLLIASVLLTGDLFPHATDPNLVVETDDPTESEASLENIESVSNGNLGSRKPAIIQAVLPRNNNSPDRTEIATGDRNIKLELPNGIPTEGSSDDTIVSVINAYLQESWDANQIEPSPHAEDAEWLRRVHLDLIGQIPAVDKAAAFLNSDDPYKRERTIDQLLDQPEFVTNWSTIWANLMVGRNPDRAENRYAVTKFLRDSFRENRPWDEVVAQVISAEGSTEDNFASGFLLAHVNNQAVPATAIASRLFLGTNVQCMQCHDHPFNTNAKQNHFWELNSFFKQTERLVERNRDPETGTVVQTVSLVTRPDAEGPTYFETRQGRVQPAYPIYNGVKVDDGAETNRREELSRLLSAGDKPQIADAYVNRLWKHFFGFGFTNPVDDMGPHNAPSHPELLDRLAREFVLSGYDQKRLMKWICLSDGYRRTSQLSQNNDIDNPELGELPLFSRVYVKSMSAEQVYNSLLVATGVVETQKGSWNDVETQRDEWMQQFVHAYENEENNEDTHFSGTITQALMLMNGDMIQAAISYEEPTFFGKLVSSNAGNQQIIEQLVLAALTRYPTDRESAMIRKMIAQNVGNARNGQRQQLVAQSLQDIFWAYLNSSEFVLVH